MYIFLIVGVAVLLSHLPIEQYRSIAWFNMACGVTVLLLFMFFFRGESSWENVSNITKMCRCSCQCKTEKDIKFGSLQIFISSKSIPIMRVFYAH